MQDNNAEIINNSTEQPIDYQIIFKNRHLKIGLKIIFFILPFLFIFWSLFIGRYDVSPVTVIKLLLSPVIPIDPTWSDADVTILWQVRLPRIIAAVLVGASLSMAGAAFQGTL